MRTDLLRRTSLLLALALAVPTSFFVTSAGAAEIEVKIIRDKFGVPHVYAETDDAASYGAGYALAQDRLWQMHVLRHIGRGELSQILGPVVVEIDKETRFMTYTSEERAERYKTYPADIRKNLEAFAAGINAWIDEVNANPSLRPYEFQKYGENIDPWTVDDSLAIQDFLVLSFGSGGGNELAYATLLDSLVEKFGKKKGKRVFDDLVMTTDPDTPLTIPKGFDWKRNTTAARTKEAQSRRKLWSDARLSLEGETRTTGDARPPAARGTFEQLSLIPDTDKAFDILQEHVDGLKGLRTMIKFGSNAQIVGPKLAEKGNALQTGGPQVGYFLPQILVDFGIHGDDIDTTGMTFAGAGPAVLIGRGSGYAWTTTTGSSDLTDTYVEKLNPDDSHQYRYKGVWEQMDCRTETYTVKGAPSEQQEICRTRHGPVLGFDEENNVAYSIRYAWFNREGQSVEGFWRYNEVKSLQDFATYANYLSSNHNMFYSDDQGNIGYWHPGNHVKRTRGIDIRLPQDGTGGSEWRGLVPIQKVPHEVNGPRGWLMNWNNQPVFNWKRERGHPALDNSMDLKDALSPGGKTPLDPYTGKPYNTDKKYDFEDMSGHLRYSAFRHHTNTYFGRFLPSQNALPSALGKAARQVMTTYNGFLTATGEDPTDIGGETHPGRTIVEAWVAQMSGVAFTDDLADISEEALGFANTSLLWHVINQRDRLDLEHNWLGKTSVRKFLVDTFEAAVKGLAEEYGNEDPTTWTQPVPVQHYTRLNAEIFEDIAECEAGDCSGDSGRPGDVEDHILMDRGTYNHVIEYLQPPSGRGLGNSTFEVGSVIPPGQNGFINPVGIEGAHFEDQLPLYVEWKYKPMPVTLAEATALKESEETITYTTEDP